MRQSLLSSLLVTLFACSGVDGSSEPATPPAPQPAEPQPAEPQPAEPRAPEQAPTGVAPAPSTPPSENVDLLHAIPTAIAVSSAYQGRASQAARLVDGDRGTAWNSRTDDLVGAWIEVRIPDGATVTSIALTSGFTHVRGESDLFSGNHRVARVRVLRDGAPIGVHDLDTDSRALQTLAVQGPAGVYRLEVLAVTSGSRDDWREVCVSELRVMGHAPDARAGSRAPAVAVGELPALDLTAAAVAAPEVDAAVRDAATAADPSGSPAIEAIVRRGLTDLYGAEEITRAAFRSLGTLGGPGGASVAYEVRTQDEMGVAETVWLVVGVRDGTELAFFAVEVGQARSEPGAEGTADLDSFTGFQRQHGVLRADLSVAESYAEFATCAECQQRRQEATIRQHFTLLCTDIPDEGPHCSLTTVGREQVSPGVLIDNDGDRRPYEDEAGEDPPELFRLRLTVLDRTRARLELVSGHVDEALDDALGEVPIEELHATGRACERLE